MTCPWCDWELGYGGSIDPCDVVCEYDEHILEHVSELFNELSALS